MSQYPCQILTNDGKFYVHYCSVIGQFVSPAVRRPTPVLFDGMGAKEVKKESVYHIFDLRTETLERIEAALVKLESGKCLNKGEAVIIANFEDFLGATVAEHQQNYDKANDEVYEKWIAELKLRNIFGNPDYAPREFVTDLGMFPAFQEKAIRAREKRPPSWMSKQPPKSAQNKIAGRYLRALATIANALGPGHSAPQDIVNKFYDQFFGEAEV